MAKKKTARRKNQFLKVPKPGVAEISNRLEALELRIGAMKTELDNRLRENSALADLPDELNRLNGLLFIVFESICNLDDLIRPKADIEDKLRSKRIEFFRKR